MRVLYFYRNDNVHDRRFLDALGRLPVEVAALALESGPVRGEPWHFPGNVKKLNWRLGDHSFSKWYELLLIADLKRTIQVIRPDVIHAGPLDVCAYYAARAGGIPLVGMSWGFDLLVNARTNRRSHQRIRYALSNMSVLLDDCEPVTAVAEELGFSRDRTVTFPWGVDLTVFNPNSGQKFRQRLGWEDRVILLSMRSMEKQYGVDLIVEAFIQAAKLQQGLSLLLLGDGSQRAHLQQRIDSAGLNHEVHFAGSVPEQEVVQFINASDVYVSASHSDGSSVSLLQAMACGKPPLVSDIPGNREWVTQDRNGWVFKIGESQSLVELILRAAGSSRLREQYGQAARAIVQKRGDWIKNSARLMDAYQMACKESPTIRRAG